MVIYEYNLSFSSSHLGRLLNDKPDLRYSLRLALNRGTYPAHVVTPPTMQYYVDMYGEQVTVDASGDLARYFSFQSSRGFGATTIGGIPTLLPALANHPGDVRPSNTAISVLAEGVAGWYIGTKTSHTGRPFFPQARPVAEAPDLVFQDGRNTVALVQVKGTQEPDIKARMADSGIPLLQYAFNEMHGTPSSYICFVIGVIILHSIDFELHSLQVDIL